MALNLLKLCVGCDSVEDLEEWIAFRLDPRLHEAAVTAAAAEDKSLNEWVAQAIETAAQAS